MTPMSIPPQQEGAAAAAADAAPQFFNPNLFAGAGAKLRGHLNPALNNNQGGEEEGRHSE